MSTLDLESLDLVADYESLGGARLTNPGYTLGVYTDPCSRKPELELELEPEPEPGFLELVTKVSNGTTEERIEALTDLSIDNTLEIDSLEVEIGRLKAQMKLQHEAFLMNVRMLQILIDNAGVDMPEEYKKLLAFEEE